MDSHTLKGDPAPPSRATGLRIFGVPIQFAIVVVISAALTIYFGAWAADSRVEARERAYASTGVYIQSPNANSGISASGLSSPVSSSSDQPVPGSEKEIWEASALFLCPLH